MPAGKVGRSGTGPQRRGKNGNQPRSSVLWIRGAHPDPRVRRNPPGIGRVGKSRPSYSYPVPLLGPIGDGSWQ